MYWTICVSLCVPPWSSSFCSFHCPPGRPEAYAGFALQYKRDDFLISFFLRSPGSCCIKARAGVSGSIGAEPPILVCSKAPLVPNYPTVMAVVLFYIAICNFERCLSYIHSSQPLKLLCPLTHIYDDMVRINGVSCPPKPFCGINSDVQRPV